MNKTTYHNTSLTCLLQQYSQIKPGQCLSGMLSRRANGFLFEESVRTTSYQRNPKLYDGNFCSLVHMHNGKYQLHMKTIDASEITSTDDLAFKMYMDLLQALSLMTL